MPPQTRVRLELVLDHAEDAHHALIIWARLHAEEMAAELAANGIVTEVVSVGVNGEPRYR
jgi:hypothetical protein